MACVVAKPGESFDSLLKRFKKAVERSGVLSDYKKHQSYEKPSVKKKRKKAAARKRALKTLKKLERYRLRNNNNKNFRWNKDRTEKIYTNPPKKQPNYRRDDTKKGSRPGYTGDKKPYNKKPYSKQPYNKKPYNKSQNTIRTPSTNNKESYKGNKS